MLGRHRAPATPEQAGLLPATNRAARVTSTSGNRLTDLMLSPGLSLSPPLTHLGVDTDDTPGGGPAPGGPAGRGLGGRCAGESAGRGGRQGRGPGGGRGLRERGRGVCKCQIMFYLCLSLSAGLGALARCTWPPAAGLQVAASVFALSTVFFSTLFSPSPRACPPHPSAAHACPPCAYIPCGWQTRHGRRSGWRRR